MELIVCEFVIKCFINNKKIMNFLIEWKETFYNSDFEWSWLFLEATKIVVF